LIGKKRKKTIMSSSPQRRKERKVSKIIDNSLFSNNAGPGLRCTSIAAPMISFRKSLFYFIILSLPLRPSRLSGEVNGYHV
ncbi:MAG: hypothetical protein Q7J61_01030, partial [Deltaproteobacteria bacterium]|nr:hypothetical protein [Deltaproteobacteria bacterium]